MLVFWQFHCVHLVCVLSLLLFVTTGQSNTVQTETSSSEWEESEAQHPRTEAGDIFTFFFIQEGCTLHIFIGYKSKDSLQQHILYLTHFLNVIDLFSTFTGEDPQREGGQA